jgi:hypothetical protein
MFILYFGILVAPIIILAITFISVDAARSNMITQRNSSMQPRFWTVLALLIETSIVLNLLFFFPRFSVDTRLEIACAMFAVTSFYLLLLTLLDIIFWRKNYFFRDSVISS